MKIISLSIKNFRCHKDLTLELNEHHTLVGENGTGKTAILEAINMACSPYYLQSRISEQDFHNADEGNISIEVTFNKYFFLKVPDGFASQNLPCQSIKLTIKRREKASPGKALSEPFTVEALCIPITFQRHEELKEEFLPEGTKLTDLPRMVQSIKEGSQSGVKITRKGGKEKTVRRNLFSITNNERIGFPNVFYFDRQREKESKVGFNSLFSKLAKELNWRFKKSAESSTVVEHWNEYYSCVMNNVEKRKKELVDPVLKSMSDVIGTSVDDLEIALLNLEEPFSKSFIAKRTGLNQVDLGGIGSGVSMLLAYYFLEHISQLSKEAVIFLIDEPELHLHPQLQQVLTKNLTSAENQTIISTHSPLFIDLGNWKGISRLNNKFCAAPTTPMLDMKLGSQMIRQHLDDISKWRQNETVFVDSDPEILFARRVLLVEGPADKYGLPRLAKVLGQSFKDTTIISCNGKTKIIHYATLCHAFEIQAFVIYDLDGKNSNEQENDQVSEAIKRLEHFTFASSFESLLEISPNAEHKASKVLEKIDSIDSASEVPGEIKTAIETISKWSQKG